MNTSVLSIADYERGDSVIRSDGTAGTAFSDSLSLGKMAVGLKFHDSATGVLKVVSGDGKARTIDSAAYAKGVWHPIKIKQIKATDTTTTNTHIELGYSGY